MRIDLDRNVTTANLILSSQSMPLGGVKPNYIIPCVMQKEIHLLTQGATRIENWLGRGEGLQLKKTKTICRSEDLYYLSREPTHTPQLFPQG